MKLKRLSEMTAEDWANLSDRELTPEELAEAHRLARESFTAADLQQFTEIDPGFPAEGLLAELEEKARQFHQTKRDEKHVP